MPGAEVAPAGAGGRPAAADGGGSPLIGTILRMALLWYMIKWMNGGTKGPATPENTISSMYRKGDPVDMYVYISEQPMLFNRSQAQLVWEEKALPLASLQPLNHTHVYHPSEAVKHNGSVYIHAVFARAGLLPSAIDASPAVSGSGAAEWDEAPGSVFVKSHPLNAYFPERQEKDGVSLLTAVRTTWFSRKVVVNTTAPLLVSYLKPNITISLVDHFNSYPRTAVPAPIHKQLIIEKTTGNYYPIVYLDEFWLLRDKYVQLNESSESIPIHLTVGPMSIWWMQLLQQMEQSFSMQVNMGLTADGEADGLKRIFIEGNPVLLAITFFVSMLHSVFDFLAFKNDIGFWKANKSMEGLSARTVIINAFCQIIVFFYLLDNNTSFVVLVSSGIGAAIECWKVTKAMDVSVSNSFPFIILKDRASYSQSQTKQYDADATRYLSYVLYPLIVGYSIYALVYEKHTSWYSWILGSLVGAVYTFGFILMCPQLYLNYKLKSVAALPWRQMTYKFLNTIIDDLFAFVIKMPTLHRLSVFRDDIVFLVYIYQRWIYRVDATRVNEFGYVAEGAAPGEGAGEPAGAITGAPPSASAAAALAGAAAGGTSRADRKAMRRFAGRAQEAASVAAAAVAAADPAADKKDD